VENKELKVVYDEMHKTGSTSWFSDGQNERELILKMGDPWTCKNVVEIGCGEGDLLNSINGFGACTIGVDYSEEAIEIAKHKHPHLRFWGGDYKKIDIDGDIYRLVLQGVLEHLDDPFTELKWMIDNLLVKGGDVITSSPCFLNPRGFVWMTLDMLGAVMSKTDLHYLNPWEFVKFCDENEYKIEAEYTDQSWASGLDMYADLMERIPLALRDGNIPYKKEKFDEFMEWIFKGAVRTSGGTGATAVYRIQT
jgi:2-polyprenyl-3-methyl-5-hydroxy-6-metoxy-1,4-benzoquinol methylase